MPGPEPQTAKESRRKPHQVGPFSRERSLMAIDGRTKPGRLLRATEADLLAQLGPKATKAQQLLAKSAALKATRIAMLAKRVTAGEELADGTDPQTLAWMNGLRADLTAMGLLPNSRIPKSANSNEPDDPDADLLVAHLRGRAASSSPTRKPASTPRCSAHGSPMTPGRRGASSTRRFSATR